MSFDIKFPNISAPTESGKIEQIKSYLYQLADQLKWALNSIESGGGKVIQSSDQSSVEAAEEEAQATFNSVKSLIIKSSDIVNAYYDEITKRLSGKYVAQSDFGSFEEQTDQNITATSKSVEGVFTNVQKIVSDIENLENSIIETKAHIRAGLLYYDSNGAAVYGLEIGQKDVVGGEEVFNKYARFTSDKLSFYDKNDTEVAYISDYKLYITNAQITGTLTLGRFVVDTSDGISIKWV